MKMQLLKLMVCSLLMVMFANTSIAQRWIRPNDVYRLTNISSPKIYPEGTWILYAQSKVDYAKDK